MFTAHKAHQGSQAGSISGVARSVAPIVQVAVDSISKVARSIAPTVPVALVAAVLPPPNPQPPN
jgi:hypothetical protein